MSGAATTGAPSPRLRAVLAAVFILLLAPPAWLSMEFDVFAAGNGPPFARFLQVAFTFALTTPALLAAFWLDRRPWKFAAYLATLAVLVTLVFVPWHPRKRFVHDLHSLENGMTVDEVEAVMGRYMKGAGRKWAVPGASEASVAAPAFPAGDERAHATGTMTYRWNDTDSSYDSDWGQVTFEDGRVVEVRFLPD